MEKLGIQPFSLIAQIVNFLILFFLLSKFLYRPMLKMLDERKRKIQQGIEKTKKIEEEMATLKAMRLKKVEEAEREAQVIIRQASQTAQEEKEKAIQQIKLIIREGRKQAREEFTKEKETLLANFRAEALDLVLLITKKFLKSSLGEKEQRKLIQNILQDLKEVKTTTK